ncbi:MAG: phosphate ABC transporter substrate-binding protein PstS [Planctomycetota bacterium]
MLKPVALSVAIVGTFFASCARSEDITIQGAGATFPAPLYSKWVAAYNKANPGIKVDYQAIGSGGGIKGITDRTVQFGASDAPVIDETKAGFAKSIMHIPTVSGSVVMIYNLPTVKALTLSGDVIADIYLGKITKWNDARIIALNVGVELPAKDIVVAHRSDGSGTTWIFTNYLSKVSAEWKAKVGNATSVKWPCGVGGKGGDGPAASVKAGEGGIGYVELSYAEKLKLPYSTLINKAGKPVRASVDGVMAAAKNTADIPDDMCISITDAPGDDSYPICGYTYLLVYRDVSYFKSKEQAEALVTFLHWCLMDGMVMAKPNYAPLNEDIRTKLLARLKTIVFNGERLLTANNAN